MATPWRSPPAPPPLGALDRVLRRLSGALRLLPPGAARRLAGRPRLGDRGVALDPHLQLMLVIEARTGRGLHAEDPVAARAEMRRGIALIDGPPVQGCAVEDAVVADDLPARFYRPPQERPPLLVWFHGGGWATGDLDTHDRFCRRMCVEGGLLVVAVDYRLAPEHPCPTPLRDAERAWADVASRAAALGADPDRLAVGGDSAGGNLAAVLCQKLRDGAIPGPTPRAQVLVYPSTDLRRQTPSHAAFAHGLLLTSESIDRFVAWFQPPDLTDPEVSPLLAADLSGLPRAVVATAGFDPLRDEGEAYVQALTDAGVAVDWLDEASLVHGYLQLDGVSPVADRAVARLAAASAGALRSLP